VKLARTVKLYILAGFSKPVMKKVLNFSLTILDESSRDVQFFREITFAIRIQTMHCLQIQPSIDGSCKTP
jgi:hypothetical protein